MGHSSIQVTVDIHDHLIPSANVSFLDRVGEAVKQDEKTTRNKMQPRRNLRKAGRK
jgi:hypothetical protein